MYSTSTYLEHGVVSLGSIPARELDDFDAVPGELSPEKHVQQEHLPHHIDEVQQLRTERIAAISIINRRSAVFGGYFGKMTMFQ